MFDAKSVMAQVTQKNYPSYWRVYYGEERHGCFSFLTRGQLHVLIILPQGVVNWAVSHENDYGWLYFPDIDKMQLAQETQINGYDGDIYTRTEYWLDVYGIDGTYMKWYIGSYFGDAASIGKSILAACSYYWQNNRFLP